MDAVEFERVSYPARPEQVPTIRSDLRTWLGTSDVPDEVTASLVLAVSEAVENAIKHAYPHRQDSDPAPNVDLTMCVDDTEVLLTVADHGAWARPATTALEHDTAAGPARHGRGIILMNAHVDDVAIHHDSRGTTVLLGSRLHRDRTPSGPARA